MVEKLSHTRKILDVPISVGVAGSNVLAKVTESVLVRLSLTGYKNISVDFSIELGVLPIPIDILISWSDIKGLNLLPLLSKMSEVCAAVAEPAVVEECYEAEVISSSDLPNQLALPQGAFGDLLRVLCNEYPEVFSNSVAPQPARVDAMSIELCQPTNFRGAMRRQSDAVRAFVSETVKKLLADGIIVESTSPVASPIVVARAPGREWRFCIDYRQLNKITVPMLHPLPNLHIIL